MSSNPPPDSPQPTPPAAPAQADVPSEIKPDDKTMAMLAHGLGIFGFLGPLIIWLIKKNQSKYVDEQGKEALNFQLTLLIGDALALATWCFVVGIFIWAAVYIIRIVFVVLSIMAVNKGEHYRYPFAIRLIK